MQTSKPSILFSFSKEDFVFRFGKGTVHPYNFLILHMKYFIFNCKINGCKPRFDNFFYKFKFTLTVEKNISVTDSNKRMRYVNTMSCLKLLNIVLGFSDRKESSLTVTHIMRMSYVYIFLNISTTHFGLTKQETTLMFCYVNSLSIAKVVKSK